jgi:hypothetical protein
MQKYMRQKDTSDKHRHKKRDKKTRATDIKTQKERQKDMTDRHTDTKKRDKKTRVTDIQKQKERQKTHE